MPYTIIIRGPLGIGKTTVAKLLADRLQGEHISMDDLLHRLGLDQVEGEGIPLKNFLQANEEIIPIIQRHIADGRIPVIDGNFYHSEQIDHLLQSIPPPHFVFTLKAPLEVCIERDRLRGSPYGEDAARAVFNLVTRFERGIVIDATQDTKATVASIMSHLKAQLS